MAQGEDAARDLTRLFENLGFGTVAAIRKRRTTFHLSSPPHHIEVTLDRVDGLGDFVEIAGSVEGQPSVLRIDSLAMLAHGEAACARQPLGK